jgi:putative Mn2+ efflux pump MntP
MSYDTDAAMHAVFGVIAIAALSSLDNFGVGLSCAVARKRITLLSNAAIALANGLTTLVTMLLGGLASRYISEDTASMLGASMFMLLGLMQLRVFAAPLLLAAGANDGVGSPIGDDGDSEVGFDEGDSETASIDGYSYEFDRLSGAGLVPASVESIRSMPHDRTTASASIRGLYGSIPTSEDVEEEDQSPPPGRVLPASLVTILSQAATYNTKKLVSDIVLKSDGSSGNRQTAIIDAKETLVLVIGLCFTDIAGGIAAGFAGYSPWATSLSCLFSSFILLFAGQVIGSVFGDMLDDRYISLVSGLGLILVGLANVPFF